MATLNTIVFDSVQRAKIREIVWALFDSTDKDDFKIKILFFNIDLTERVRQWIITKFGLNPKDTQY